MLQCGSLVACIESTLSYVYMPLPIFDRVERADLSRRRYSESAYNFLNRSSMSETEAVRGLVDDWAVRFPPSTVDDLVNRLRSSNDGEHRAALFELFLHELLIKLGCRVEIHPTVPGRRTSPDFRVQGPNGESCYVEARIVNDQLQDPEGVERRRNRILDILNGDISPDFWLSLEEHNIPSTDPRTSAINTQISTWLRTLNWREERRRMESDSGTEHPTKTFNFDGYCVTIQAIPRAEERRGDKAGGNVAVPPTRGAFVQRWNAVRDAIKAKASRYGELGAPFVICLDVVDSTVWDDQDIVEALLGEEEHVEVRQPDGSWDSQMRRATSGAFVFNNQPRNTRVSAVVAFRRLHLPFLEHALVRCFHNPWAKYPYEGPLRELPQARNESGTYRFVQGRSIAQVKLATTR